MPLCKKDCSQEPVRTASCLVQHRSSRKVSCLVKHRSSDRLWLLEPRENRVDNDGSLESVLRDEDGQTEVVATGSDGV